ncbi:hypothetical protein J7J39_02085 [bacterium]|nr:hypothetical protein [bacterium]
MTREELVQEFLKVVKEKGEEIERVPLILTGRESSTWIVKNLNLIIVLDEDSPYPEGRVISVIERGQGFLYLSPFAVSAGALEIFGIEDDTAISSEERIKEILGRLKRLVRT